MSISPTQRSKKWLEDQGFTVAIVEKWNSHVNIRQDLFGFIDLIALRPGETWAVQTTTNNGGNVAAHIHKIHEAPKLPAVLASGWFVWVHGWWKPANARSWDVRTVQIVSPHAH